MEIVAATRNRKKLAEIQRILGGLPVTLFNIDDFPGCPEVEETEATFEGNAVKKAVSVAKFTGKAAIADDSGLVVDALGGAPGVRSARYSEGGTDRENLEKLLKEMQNVPDDKRNARFICVIALALPDGSVRAFEGSVEGRIGRTPRGVSGFGYDPVFYPEGYSRTFAEMTPAGKDAMSHRARALSKFAAYLKGCGILKEV